MELKFRAWDKHHKDMEYVTDLYWFEERGVHDADGSGLCSEYDIMPFTGIHDKKGKEIYLGDIVLTQERYNRPYSQSRESKRHIGVVEYLVHTCGCGTGKEYGAEWIVKVKDYEGFTHGAWGYFYDCEVIGNIYENPELLS